PDFTFPLYGTSFPDAGMPVFPGGLLAFPGDTVAVAPAIDPDSPFFDSVVVYDHGVARADQTHLAINEMQWDSTGTIIYGANAAAGLTLARLQPTATGIKLLDTLPHVAGIGSGVMQELRCQSDICFDAAGDILDARALKYLGHCPLSGRVLPDVPRS